MINKKITTTEDLLDNLNLKKKTEIKLGIKTNNFDDPILSECISLSCQWIKKNAPKFKSIKFELGEWTREDYPYNTNTKLMIEVHEDIHEAIQ